MPSDEDIQEAILERLCEAFKQQPGLTILKRQPIEEEVADELSISESDVTYQLERLDGDRNIDFSKSTGGAGSVELEAGGIEKYEALSGETVVSNADIETVLGELYEEERDNPSRPGMSRDDLLDRTGLSEDDLDMVIWYLKEKYLVDALTHTGRPWYSEAEITDSGRTQYERM